MSKNLFSEKNDLTLNLIDWKPLINNLSRLFKFNKNRSKVDNLFDKRERINIHEELKSITFFQSKLDSSLEKFNHLTKYFQTDFDPFLSLKKVNKGEILELSEINSICHLITFYKESGGKLTANWDKNKNFTISQESIFKLSKDLLKPFRSFVEPSGSIFYEKHPLLKAIYFQIKYEEKQIKNLLNFLLNSDKLAQAFNTKALILSMTDILFP